MNITEIGKDIPDRYVAGRLDRLKTFLAYIDELGYALGELSITGLNVIIDGKLMPNRVKQVQHVLAGFPLKYTVHAPRRMNLAFGYDLDREKAVFRACLEFCHSIDAHTLVYHSGLQALDAARTGTVSLPDDDALVRGAEREVAALREIGPLAADLGVTIGMENGDPHLWEYATLKANNKPSEELPRYHARLRIGPIVDQLTAVDHPGVGMTLDLGHLYLASRALGVNFLDEVARAAPWVRHLHVNDNFGRLDVGFDDEADRLPYGEADLHLPPGLADIPYAEAFRLLEGYEGRLILEIKERYWDNFGEALKTCASCSSVKFGDEWTCRVRQAR